MQDDTAFAVDDKAGANEHNVDADSLTDVKMTADASAAVAFGGESSIVAEKSLDLAAATYDVQDGETVDFDTTQEQLASKMEIKTLTGIKGFTITGAMNDKYDWTKLEAKTITLTPTYELIDAAEAAAEAAIVNTTATYDSSNLRYIIALPEGVTIENISEVTAIKVNDNAISSANTNNAGDVVRVTRDDVKTALGDAWGTTDSFTFTFVIDGVKYRATVAKNG